MIYKHLSSQNLKISIIMKNLILPLLLLVTTVSFGQLMVGKTDINNRHLQYVEIWDKPIKSIGKSYAMIDYGQSADTDEKANASWAVSNRNGAPLEFNGIVDVLNYMYRNGWEIMHNKSTEGYESYLMKRREGYVEPNAGMSKN